MACRAWNYGSSLWRQTRARQVNAAAAPPHDGATPAHAPPGSRRTRREPRPRLRDGDAVGGGERAQPAAASGRRKAARTTPDPRRSKPAAPPPLLALCGMDALLGAAGHLAGAEP